MRKALQSVLVLASTLGLLIVLFLLNPFVRASAVLDRLFGAPPSWMQVADLYRDPATQEITHGENPVPGLAVLARYWGEHPSTTRILFVGNSQMHTVSLARGEDRPSKPEKTYVDWIADDLASDRANELVYRLSSSGMSYPEVLWELMYMVDHPDLHPSVVVLQINYQAFWTGNIRDSLLPLLNDERFRASVERAANSDLSYAGDFREALRRYEQSSLHFSPSEESGENARGALPFQPARTSGYRLETALRSRLDQVRLFKRRLEYRDDFAQLLYRCRLYFLGLKPSTGRSITGSQLLAARAAIASLVALSKQQNLRLLMFYAPVNPRVSLYRTSQDRVSYRAFVDHLAAANSVPLYDFENSIPAERWGNLLNGPDPLHMGRAAHQDLAAKMVTRMNLPQLAGRK
jgi:hypothetical protein